jgi:hypothetical protein
MIIGVLGSSVLSELGIQEALETQLPCWIGLGLLISMVGHQIVYGTKEGRRRLEQTHGEETGSGELDFEKCWREDAVDRAQKQRLGGLSFAWRLKMESGKGEGVFNFMNVTAKICDFGDLGEGDPETLLYHVFISFGVVFLPCTGFIRWFRSDSF